VRNLWLLSAGVTAAVKPKPAVTEDTREVIQWLRRPPLPNTARLFYWLFFQAALASLPANYRELLGLKSMPLKITRPITTSVLRFMRFAIGPDSPIEDAAIARLKRAGIL
jgi:hypothetical protein